jgi:hypothetical protein
MTDTPSERAMAAGSEIAAITAWDEDEGCRSIAAVDAAAIIDEHCPGYDELLAALVRMVGSCTRYLEEMDDEGYIGPLQQARAAFAAAKGTRGPT